MSTPRRRSSEKHGSNEVRTGWATCVSTGLDGMAAHYLEELVAASGGAPAALHRLSDLIHFAHDNLELVLVERLLHARVHRQLEHVIAHLLALAVVQVLPVRATHRRHIYG
eukprot:3377105-Pleurochrysis_carterae.AAC.3